MSSITSPEDPDEQFEFGVRLLQQSWRTKVQLLENESSGLKQVVKEKDNHIGELERRIMRLEMDIQESVEKQQQLVEEKNKIINENVELTQEVRKVKKELSKLLSFKKAIMNTFDEEESNSDLKNSSTSPKPTTKSPKSSLSQTIKDPLASMESPLSSSGRSSSHPYSDLHLDTDTATMDLISQIDRSIRTPSSSSGVRPSSPLVTSPSRAKVNFDDWTSSPQLTRAANLAQSDGKSFFKEARQKLSWEQFNQLLGNIKKLNNHTQSREETLETARQLFGDQNKDLYWTFKRLLSRHI